MTDCRVLLVGGSGFLGTQLTSRLEAEGWEVGILDRTPPQENSLGCTVFTGELRDMDLVRRAISSFPRIIYLAHETQTAPAADVRSDHFLRNMETFLGVLDQAVRVGVQDFVLFSSGGAVYGEALLLPVSEEHPKNPVSPYGLVKLTMEKYLAMTSHLQGFRHLCIRPSNPYGPGQNFEGAQGLASVAMAKIARGETITIFGDGSTLKDFLFVDDLSAAVGTLLAHPNVNGCFNVGSGIGVSVLELIREIESVVGVPACLEYRAPAASDVARNVLDITKIREATGWVPTTDREEGLVRLWEWMRPRLKPARDAANH